MKILQYDFDNQQVVQRGKPVVDGVMSNMLSSVNLDEFKAVVVVVQPFKKYTKTNVLLFESEQAGWEEYTSQKIQGHFATEMIEYYNIEDFKSLMEKNNVAR